MLRAIVDLYRQAWRYALACPILFLVPIAAEAAQHVVEYAQGFYDGIAHARAVEHSLLRMGFGSIKILALQLAGYWVTRWLAWGQADRVGRLDRRNLVTYLPFFALEATLGIAQIWAPTLVPALARPILWFELAMFLIGIPLSDWSRTAPLGEEGGPIVSFRLVTPCFLWGLAMTLLAVLPPMAVHYALSFGAMKATGLPQFAVLAADTLFVGYLGAVVAGIPWYISEHARARFERRLTLRAT